MSTALLASFLLLTAVIINSGGLNTNGIITCNTCQNMKSINSDSRVLINGYNSAKNSIIQSPMIKCHGNQACINTEIKADELDCNGYQACKQSELYIDKLLTCNKDSSCKESIITMNIDDNDNTEIYALDSNTLSYSKIIGATIIYGYGQRSLSNSYITSIENKDLMVYSHGLSAGINSNIICKSGSKCTINCQSNACKDLTITCLSGSDCHLIPDLCEKKETQEINSIVDEIDCPILIKSDTLNDDQILLNEIEDNYYSTLDTLNLLKSERIIQKMITRSSTSSLIPLNKDIIIDSKGGDFQIMNVEISDMDMVKITTIICRKGYECNLNCIGKACTGTHYLCYYDSICHINCIDTDQDDQCPEIEQSLSYKDDKQFDQYLENKFIGNDDNEQILVKEKKSKEMMKRMTNFMLHSWPYLLLSSILLILFVIGIFGLIYYFIKNQQTNQLNTYNNPLFLK